jgi:hypothetical protein
MRGGQVDHMWWMWVDPIWFDWWVRWWLPPSNHEVVRVDFTRKRIIDRVAC